MGVGPSKIRSYFHKWKKDENFNDGSLETIQPNGIHPEHESIEMEEVTQNLSHLSAKIKTCINKDDFLRFLDTTDESASESSSLMIKFMFMDIMAELNPTDIQNISKKYHGKSKVLLLMSENEEKFSIFWKSKEIHEFIEFKHSKKLDWESDRSLSDYVAEFLVKSLKNNHLGLVSKFPFHHGTKPIDIDLLADSRDFNLLLLAAESGNAEIVEIFLKLDLSTSSMDNKVDAQTLAMEGQHVDVIYALLQNNLMFPALFNVSNCTGRLKKFCEVTEEVHNLIISNETDKLEEILNKYKNFRHFYNFSNESALRVAIKSQSFDAFDILLSKNLRFGSNENPAEYYEEMDTGSKRLLRDIQNKYSQPFLDKHIHTLLSKSTACFDETEAKDKLNNVHRAFELLSENPFIKIILKIVAASKNFKIVFDFNREAINVVDPTTNEFTQGIFYLSGKIFIGAKQLLDPGTENETLAVLSHELCHFAMNLVYKNKANPYKSQDNKTMEQFEEVSRNCKTEAEVEEVISSVFDCYPEKAHHAELIVRVVHLLALYRDMPEIIEQQRRIFIKLFEFYENKIVPELEKALPELEGRDEKELKLKDKKIYKLRKISIIAGVLAVIGIVVAIIVALLLYTPTYTFKDLSVSERMTVFKAPIRYKNVDLELHDLFLENSTVYKNLTSEHISQIKHRKVLDFSDPHLHYLDDQVTHKWENMAKKLKEHILTSNFTFQNETLKFEKLHEINSEVFSSLTSAQILDVLKGKELLVHEMIKNETKFYFERKFWDENIREIYYEFMKSANGIYNFSSCSALNNTQTKKTFENFYLDFKSQNVITQLNKINEIRQMEVYKMCSLSDFKIFENHLSRNVSDNILFHKQLQFNFDQVLKIANDSKLFILSSEAGTGKTVTFEQFSMRIKKQFPTRWVSYIDLKDYKHLYKRIRTLQDVKNMLETIFKLNSKNEFEKKIFENFLKSGNLVLLWNGFDEISPDFSDDVIRILELIKNETKNIQFLCTRTLYSDQLKHKFWLDSYSLIPLDEESQENYVKNYFIAENVEKSKIPNYVEKVQKVINFTESQEPIDTPLMLGMIAELIANDVEIQKSENLFEMYQKFVEKKIEIWKKKSDFGKKFVDEAFTKYSQFNMMKVYQSYALKLELQKNEFTYFSSLKLKVMHQKVPKELTSDEISRMGILNINGPRNIKFAHRTFMEFFIAQYFIENIYNADDEPSDKEAESRIFNFNYALTNNQIEKFIKSFLDSRNSAELKHFDPQISKILTSKYKKSLISNKKPLFLIDFYKKDLKVLKKLLQLDENETFYTMIFNHAKYLDVDPLPIKKIVKPFLSNDEFKRFIRGKDQKGVILFSEYCGEHRGTKMIHDYYKLDKELVLSNDPFYVFESIAKNLTENELKELLMSRIIFMKLRSPTGQNHKIFNQKMWNLIENRLKKSDQKKILAKSLKPSSYFENRNDLNFLLQKCDKILSSDEILQIFKESKCLLDVDFTFIILWNFFINHTNREQQKSILKQTQICEEKFCLPVGLFFTPNYEFVKMQEIYEFYFNETELQDYILSHSSDTFPNLIIWLGKPEFLSIIKFLMKLFQSNLNLLREFLLQKIEPTSLNIFELFSDYNDPKGNLQILSQFLNPNIIHWSRIEKSRNREIEKELRPYYVQEY